MSAHLWLVFILASLPVHGAPGPNNLLALGHGMALGPVRAALAMLARLPGYVLIFAAAGLGLGAVLLAFPAVFRLVTVAGGVYLAWLGFSAIRASSTAFDAGPASTHVSGAARAEFLAAIANPKAILFATAFYAQFIDPQAGGYTRHYVSMVAVSLSLESLFGLAYCVAGALARNVFGAGALSWMARGSGAVLCAMGVGLVAQAVTTV